MPTNNRTVFYAFISLLVGVIASFFPHPLITKIAQEITGVYMNFIKFISVPVIFFSILSAITQLDCAQTLKKLMGSLLKYTLLTTVIAGFVAMGCYLLFSPARHMMHHDGVEFVQSVGYLSYLSRLLPDNMVRMFVDGNVASIVLAAIAMGIAAIHIDETNRHTFKKLTQALFEMLMKLAQGIIITLPFIVWAFVLNVIAELSHEGMALSLLYYFSAIMLANFIQAAVVLPLFLRYHGFNPWETIRGAWPAITTAFFTKSSYAAIPTTMNTLTHTFKADPKIVSFAIPLSSTINMNACAAFIYITVLFVAQSYGMEPSFGEMILWVLLATAAAVGNAGVPMGCFFMSSAILAALECPTALMGAILPFYALLDMFETGLNVFSDVCVTRAVDKKHGRKIGMTVPALGK